MSRVFNEILSRAERKELSLGPIENLLVESYLLSTLTPTTINSGVIFYWLNNDVSLTKVKNFLKLLQPISNHQSPITIYLPSWQKLDCQHLLQVANNEPLLIIATNNHWQDQVPNLENILERTLTLTIDEKYPFNYLKKRLIDWEFINTPQLSHALTFSIKGSIWEIWPENQTEIFRLIFDDDQLKKIQLINLADKQIIKEVETVVIYPPENLITNRENFINLLPKNGRHLFSSTLINNEITFLPGQHLFFNPLPTKPSSGLEPLPKNLSQNLVGQKFFWLTHEPERAQEIIKQKNLPALLIESEKTLTDKGFLTDDLIITTDFDWHLEPAKKIRANLQLIANLKPNDLVVHTDHGIGTFKELTSRIIDGLKKEYVLVEYADQDKLFIPVEMSDRLEKYWGPANPNIHRLGATSTWQNEKAKVKAQAEQIAAELLQLAAQRELTPAQPLWQLPEQEDLIKSFAFTDTPDQQTAWQEISGHLTADKPTDILLCGDTGFGKTEIAVRAAYQAVLNQTQVALLCPTTILAQQHLDTFTNRLGKLGVTIASLSRWQKPKEQKIILEKLKNKELDIVIGTQRVLSRDVIFNNLGLVIIDEEQRFGLSDKEHLKKLKTNAHVLSLTATPIPRTLHLSLSGLKQLAIMTTAPVGRLPIQTEITYYEEELIKKAIQTEINRGGQVYFLHNEVATINLFCDHWQKLMPEVSFGIAHGQMKPPELEKIMNHFDLGQIQVLICSSIVENGLDLPNVNTLIVDNAVKFGLADLYQLRGRVGRGNKQAFAYFLYQRQKLTGLAAKRLQAILQAAEIGSGWSVALRDLEIRGAGEILGTRQHGTLAAIGLGLYSKLLEEAISKAKDGTTLETPPAIIIDLPIESFIPEELTPDLVDRLHIYQQLSNSLSLAELENNWQKYFPEKMTNYPPALQNFYQVLQIKILAQKIGLNQISCYKKNDLYQLKIVKTEFWSTTQVENIIKTNQAWEFKNNEIRKNSSLPLIFSDLKNLLNIL